MEGLIIGWDAPLFIDMSLTLTRRPIEAALYASKNTRSDACRPHRGGEGGLGVRASHRGRGIGSAMPLLAFAGFAARGLARAMVNVDAENTGATGVYERVGTLVVGRWDLWERPGSAPR